MMRIFFIVCLSLFSFAYAESNTCKVLSPASIMRIEAVEGSKIFLDNQMVWNCKYKDLFEGENGWRLGDRVHIVYVYSEGYYLQNASCLGSVPVKLLNANSKKIQATTIEEIIKNDDKSSHTIVLNDETRWLIGSWSSVWMKSWQAGDRMIITEQDFLFGKADHLLLNLDKQEDGFPENVRAQLLFSPVITDFEDSNKREPRNWEMVISNIWQKDDSCLIELNNKTFWKSAQSLLNWKAGDSLRIDYDKRYEIKNLKNLEITDVVLLNLNSEEIDLPVIKKISDHEKKLILSDESVWFSAHKDFKKWSQGDRIIVSLKDVASINTSTHILINIDKSLESSATFIK